MMLKKTKMFVLLAMIVITLFSSFSLSAMAEDLYVNDQGVEIDNETYNKLMIVGYTKDEIHNLSVENVEKIRNMNILFTNKEMQYLKNTKYYYEDGSYETKSQVVSQSDVLNRKNSFSLVGSYPSEFVSITIDYTLMEVYGTYYYDREDYGVFFIKVNVTWLNTPNDRFEDIIGINFTDELQINNVGNNIDFIAKFNYTEHYYQDYRHQYGEPLIENRETKKEEVIDGSDGGKYKYDLGKGIAVRFALPRNSVYDYSNEIVDQHHEYNYYDFFMTIEANFIPKFDNIVAEQFVGLYVNQSGAGNIDFGKISLSTAYPYFQYENSFWVNDPSFDTPITKELSFKGLQNYR